jgi:glutathione S-transferase
MTATYRLFGAETSAYSTKMRSYLAYKGVAFEWLPRTQATEAALTEFSRFPTLPVLVTASGFAVHDTTQMMEALEADSPEPRALPEDPALAFLAFVLEEYADTWLVKTAYHYRWTRKKDQRLAAQRAVEEYYTEEPPEDRKALEDQAIVRMLDQLRAVGVDGEFGAALEKSFKRFVKLFDDHLGERLYLFGARPSVADFAVAGQIIQMLKDPTPAKILEKDGPRIASWCERMAAPAAEGDFEAIETLRPTLAPLFAEELGTGFLPWAAENLESSLAGAEAFEVAVGRETFRLTPLRSAARSFRELRRRFVSAQDIPELMAFTEAANVTSYLLRPQDAERLARRKAEAAAAPASDPVEADHSAAETSEAAPQAAIGEALDSPSRDAAEAPAPVSEAGAPGDAPSDVETAAAPPSGAGPEPEPAG